MIFIYLLAIPLLLLIAFYLAVWALIFTLFVATVRPYAKSRPRVRKYFYVPMLVLFWWYPVWDLFPGPLLVNWSCERYGGFRVYIDGPVLAQGFAYEGDPVPGRSWGRIYNRDTIPRIVHQLIHNRLAYIELKNFKSSGKGEQITYYQRYSIERRDSGRCPTVEGNVARTPIETPAGTCLAVVDVDAPMAPIRVTRDTHYRTYFPTTIAWDRYSVEERGTNELLAEHRRFTHHLFWGWLSTGTQCARKARSFDVFDLDVVKGHSAS